MDIINADRLFVPRIATNFGKGSFFHRGTIFGIVYLQMLWRLPLCHLFKYLYFYSCCFVYLVYISVCCFQGSVENQHKLRKYYNYNNYYDYNAVFFSRHQ